MQKLLLLTAVIAGTVGVGSTVAEVPSGNVVLFVDDGHIAQRERVVRTVHPPEPLPQPVLEPERPWESVRLHVGTVDFDPQSQQFQMWYHAHLLDDSAKDQRLTHSRKKDLVLRAKSADGVHWEREVLELYTWNRDSSNNIVFDFHSPSVVFDRSPARAQFWMAGYGKGGYLTARSADGFHWTETKKLVSGGDNITLTRSPQTGEFLAYLRIEDQEEERSRRKISLSRSTDFQSWSAPVEVLVPDETDDVWVTRPETQRTHFYRMTVSPRAGLFLGFVTICQLERMPIQPAPHQSADEGPMAIEMVYSRDGVKWERFAGRPTILKPRAGHFDQGAIFGVGNLLDVGNETWIYYSGMNVGHGGTLPPKRRAIGLATWKRNRFVSLSPETNGIGIVETVLLPPGGGPLFINADASAGSVVVELLDADRRLLPGYRKEITGDDIAHEVRWNDSLRTGESAKPVSIRFTLQSARLYGFHWAD
ncbi:hypothetical protein [Planctomicrobium sp. SH664]|uniref:hypothetical protein n=1 Tax=Planctomicrobium sp. SH664 TaxID=3448125 RepID=UPI003F5C5A3D